MHVNIDHFTGVRGVPIHAIHSLPAARPKAEVIVVHGYSDHGERKGYTFDVLGDAGYRLHCIDHRGHGRSGGVRGYFRHFDDVLEDTETFIRRIQEETAGERRVFLLGDSMGAIATACVLARHRVDVDGAAMSGLPLLPTRAVSRTSEYLGRALASLAPRLLVPTFDPHIICRDTKVVDDYMADPLVFYARKIRLRSGMEIVTATRWLKQNLPRIDQPVLFQHGTADQIARVESSRLAYDTVSSTDKDHMLYEGLFHAVWLDPEYRDVLGDVAAWLEDRCA